jgi:hypothetical protein
MRCFASLRRRMHDGWRRKQRMGRRRVRRRRMRRRWWRTTPPRGGWLFVRFLRVGMDPHE